MVDKGLSILAILVFTVLLAWIVAMATGLLIEAVGGPLDEAGYMLLGMLWGAILMMPASVYILESLYD